MYQPDIIALTETWLSSKVSGKEYCIDGYQIPVRQDRLDTKDGRGGGVLLYIKTGINFTQIFPEYSKDYTNSIWINVVSDNGAETVIGVIYRSPNSCMLNNNRLINSIQELSHRNLVIIGDFNYPDIDWMNLSASGGSLDFMNVVMDNFLCQHVDFPTRGDNTLDLLLTSDPNMVRNIENIGKLGSSDHVIIWSELNIANSIVENHQQVPDWKRADIEGIKSSLDINWQQELENKDTFECWDTFTSVVYNAISNNVPLKERRVKSGKKTMDDT